MLSINYLAQFDIQNNAHISAITDFKCVTTVVKSAKAHKVKFKVGQVFASVTFYNSPESK